MTVTNLAEYRVRKLLEKNEREMLAGNEEAKGFWQLFRGHICDVPPKKEARKFPWYWSP